MREGSLAPSRGRAARLAAAALMLGALPVLAALPALGASEDGFNGLFEYANGNAFRLSDQLTALRRAAVAMPLACILGAMLSFRPRRPGTPPRTPSVIQTQVILAVVGALVMLVVGSSLARAFGIVGVASLIRYRAKVDDPKDAGVMLAALGVGLASGVALYLLAVFATLFLLVTLWLLESFEPKAQRVFHLKIACENAPPRPRIEELLRRLKVDFELRSASDSELCYEVKLPFTAQTDRLSSALVASAKATSVVWERKSPKNGA